MAPLRSRVEEGKSTIYVLGELEPQELALFDAEEIRVTEPAGPRVEVKGHGIGYWRAGVATSRAFGAVIEGERLLRLTPGGIRLAWRKGVRAEGSQLGRVARRCRLPNDARCT